MKKVSYKNFLCSMHAFTLFYLSLMILIYDDFTASLSLFFFFIWSIQPIIFLYTHIQFYVYTIYFVYADLFSGLLKDNSIQKVITEMQRQWRCSNVFSSHLKPFTVYINIFHKHITYIEIQGFFDNVFLISYKLITYLYASYIVEER